MDASPHTREWLGRYYALVDTGDTDGLRDFFEPDATMRIADHRPRRGRDAILAALQAGRAAVRGFRHEVKGVWEEDGGVLVFEVDVAYTLDDGREVTIPGSAFCVVRDGRFVEQRLYADFGPVL